MPNVDELSEAPQNRVSGHFQFLPIEQRQSRYLASWRGGSAILVLIGHAFDIFHPDPHPIWGVLSTSAVLVFFGLSGFFIHKALSKSMAGGGTWSFAIGRINRIIPPFALSLIVVVLLWALAPSAFLSGDRTFVTPTARTEFSLTGIVPSMLFLNGFTGPTLSANGPLWSLSYEIWYYVAAYLVGVTISRRWRWPIALAAVMLVVLTVINPRFAIFGFIWALGFGLSALHGRSKIPDVREAPLLIAAIASIALAAFEAFRGAALIANVVVGLWFVTHMARTLRGQKPWRLDYLEWTSHFAYALYVLHFPVLLFAYGALGEQSWVGGPAALTIFISLALFGRRLEETKLIRRSVGKASHPNTRS